MTQQENFQNGSKLDPSKSVLDPLNTIKKKRDQVFNVWRIFEEFSGFGLHTRYIINVIPLVLLDKFFPDFCNFLILLYNFAHNVKAHIKLTDKHTSRTLADMVSTIFNIFDYFWSLDGLFLPGHVIILQLFIFPFFTPLNYH